MRDTFIVEPDGSGLSYHLLRGERSTALQLASLL